MECDQSSPEKGRILLVVGEKRVSWNLNSAAVVSVKINTDSFKKSYLQKKLIFLVIIERHPNRTVQVEVL